MAVRAMLARVAKLEQGRGSAFTRLFGSFAEFEAVAVDGIASGRLDARDMQSVVASVRRWLDEAP